MKKKIGIPACIFILLLAAVILFTQFGKLDFSAQYIQVGHINTDEPVVKIESPEQLQEFYSSNSEHLDHGYGDIISFAEAVKKYDNDFFEKSMLAIVLLNEGSGSARHKVESVDKGIGGVKINIERIVPEVSLNDLAAWHIIVELNRSDLPLNTVFSVNMTRK